MLGYDNEDLVLYSCDMSLTFEGNSSAYDNSGPF